MTASQFAIKLFAAVGMATCFLALSLLVVAAVLKGRR